MDQHKEKEKEDKFQESSEQPRKEEAEEADTCEESWEQQPVACKEGRSSEEEEEELTVQLKVVESAAEEEEASSSPFGIFAHPCSLLRYLLRFCAGCWGLHGAFGDEPQPQAAVVAPEAVAPANSSEKGEEKEKANYFYMQGEVVTRVWAVRRGRPPGAPGHPREGSGGYGGHHN